MKSSDISNNRINLIAGSGKFALEVAQFLKNKGKLNKIILIQKNNKISNHFVDLCYEIDIRFIEKIISYINKSGSNKILIIGYVNIPKISQIKLNLRSKLFFTKDFFSNNINEQSLILKRFLISKKFNLISQKKIFKELLIRKDENIIKFKHRKIVKEIVSNSKIYKNLFKLNLFQSFIQNGNRIIAFEDIHGTDKMIKRIGGDSFNYNKMIFFKSKKSNQIDEIDFPVIGIDTINLLIKYNFKAVCLFNNEIIVSNKKKFLDTIRLSDLSLIVL